ncbi:hypothetical protein Cgig2_015646 [Carnegiea gigantea]|uniref:Maf-like protein n=1 Tax=Carnegiea gigantea TaxID=171969 RepID=A0A9Q1K2I3_9CARY|nr:hypothetical protein Cgig2_015646 [Carnegiea gigantea]
MDFNANASPFKIILGSKSIARRKILVEMGYEFTIMTADIDEKAIRKEKPEELVMALAEAKADAIISRLQIADEEVNDTEPTLLIASDTLAVESGIKSNCALKIDGRGELVISVKLRMGHYCRSLMEMSNTMTLTWCYYFLGIPQTQAPFMYCDSSPGPQIGAKALMRSVLFMINRVAEVILGADHRIKSAVELRKADRYT